MAFRSEVDNRSRPMRDQQFGNQIPVAVTRIMPACIKSTLGALGTRSLRVLGDESSLSCIFLDLSGFWLQIGDDRSVRH